jgi:uncharacterized HAD superfamily protein
VVLMIIACDIDDVLVDLCSAVAAFHNARYGTDLRVEDFTSHRAWEVWGGTREEMIDKMDVFFATGAFESLPLVDGAADALRQLSRRHKLVAVTGRPDELSGVTRALLDREFGGLFLAIHHTNFFTHARAARSKADVCREIGAEIMIEDVPDHAIDCANAGMRVILFDRPWNKGVALGGRGSGSIERVRSWDEALALFM